MSFIYLFTQSIHKQLASKKEREKLSIKRKNRTAGREWLIQTRLI